MLKSLTPYRNWTNTLPVLLFPSRKLGLFDRLRPPQMLNFSTPAARQCEHANGRDRLPWLLVRLSLSEAITQHLIASVIKPDSPFIVGRAHDAGAGVIGAITLTNGVAEYSTEQAKGACTCTATSRHDGATSLLSFYVGSSLAADHVGQKAIYVTGFDFPYGAPSNERDNMALYPALVGVEGGGFLVSAAPRNQQPAFRPFEILTAQFRDGHSTTLRGLALDRIAAFRYLS